MTHFSINQSTHALRNEYFLTFLKKKKKEEEEAMSMIYISLCILLNMLDKYNSLFILTCPNYIVITKKKKKILILNLD